VRILVYEFASGGGLAGRDLPASLAREGAAMRAALVEDLAATGGHRIVTTADARTADRLPPDVEVAVLPAGDGAREAALGALIAAADGVWLIAPESDGCLEQLAGMVEQQGRTLFGSGAAAIACASDKARLPARLACAGVPHPVTCALGRDDDPQPVADAIGYPIVVKPARGAGSHGVGLAVTARDLERAVADARRATADHAIVLQQYIRGAAASVSLLADGLDAVALALNTQTFGSPPPFGYRGGETPFAHPLAPRALATAVEACRALPGLRGYVGVDVVVTGAEVFVIEVNPRLTTAYLGLRAAVDENLAMLALAACGGTLPAAPPARRRVRFSASGDVTVLDAREAPVFASALGAGVIGWDVGGANIKMAQIDHHGGAPIVVERSFPLWRECDRLPSVLASLAGVAASAPMMVVTMTAELADCFATKRDGVASVVDAFETAFPASALWIFGVDGRFHSADEARQRPHDVAAANWMATATLVAQCIPDALLIDVGSTTTDIIPIVEGRVVATGADDPGRLQSGELVYTGCLRTPVCAIVRSVPLDGARCRIAAEHFAIAADVYRWLGRIADSDYTCETPDGRGPRQAEAGARLARMVCADREMLDAAAVTAIAEHVARMQTRQIAQGIRQVTRRLGAARPRLAVVAGSGAFLARAAAERAGLTISDLSDRIGADAARAAPAAAVAVLFSERAGSLHSATSR